MNARKKEQVKAKHKTNPKDLNDVNVDDHSDERTNVQNNTRSTIFHTNTHNRTACRSAVYL